MDVYSCIKNLSKKHQPKGLNILYEDLDIIVVDKINGLLTMGTDREREKTAYYLLTNYVKKGNQKSKNRIFIVHRLDRDTSGVLIFAKNEKGKRHLQDNWQTFSKTYFAIVHGSLPQKHDIITSYLVENKSNRMYSVKDPEKGKLSKTEYKVIKESGQFSLLEIQLHTGRKNQIRVHLSEKGYPVVGDKVYGIPETGIKRLALHAASLRIIHPYTRKEIQFETDMPSYFESLMRI